MLRMSCIYGPRQMGNEDQGWVAHFLIRALKGQQITLFGDGCQVRDILDVFSALEVRAVALAAARPPAPADAARLTQLVQRMERATEAGDIARWSDLDDDFHSTLVGLCGNARLLRSIGEYWGQQYRGRRLILPHRPLPEDSNREHRVILQAVLAVYAYDLRQR